MRSLTYWFRAVGALYLFLGVMWLPPLTSARLTSSIPGFDGPAGGTAEAGFVDHMVMFSLELLVLGGFLVFASFRPQWHEPLLWLVVALSVVRGIIDDIYMIVMGYPVGLFLAFIALHAAVIVSALLCRRAARRTVPTPTR